MLTVIYKKPIKSGERLALNQVKYEPIVEIYPSDSKNLYTLLMTDPDAPYPENPTYADYLHWLVVNIGNDTGNIKTPYTPPNPPKDSLPHRYIFEVYKQQGPMPKSRIDSGSRFDKKAFIKSNGLKLLDRVCFLAGR